ncbi:Chromatin assembly complex, subunit 3 [Branchiostoma belcheri]|nr:Chromatin assembly complex, subunit 3 [Branchiostoma belcheri]
MRKSVSPVVCSRQTGRTRSGFSPGVFHSVGITYRRATFCGARWRIESQKHDHSSPVRTFVAPPAAGSSQGCVCAARLDRTPAGFLYLLHPEIVREDGIQAGVYPNFAYGRGYPFAPGYGYGFPESGHFVFPTGFPAAAYGPPGRASPRGARGRAGIMGYPGTAGFPDYQYMGPGDQRAYFADYGSVGPALRPAVAQTEPARVTSSPMHQEYKLLNSYATQGFAPPASPANSRGFPPANSPGPIDMYGGTTSQADTVSSYVAQAASPQPSGFSIAPSSPFARRGSGFEKAVDGSEDGAITGDTCSNRELRTGANSQETGSPYPGSKFTPGSRPY